MHNGKMMSWAQIGVIVTAFGVIAAIHGNYVVPAVVAKARDMMLVELDRHGGRPHAGAMTKADMQILSDRLDALATKDSMTELTRRIDRLQARLEK